MITGKKLSMRLIYDAILAFGHTTVREVMDLVEVCSDLENLKDTFTKLRMHSHFQCLEMLFVYE